MTVIKNLGRHNLPLDECIDNTQVTNSEKREKEKK
jgi:hypothetical protein